MSTHFTSHGLTQHQTLSEFKKRLLSEQGTCYSWGWGDGQLEMKVVTGRG